MDNPSPAPSPTPKGRKPGSMLALILTIVGLCVGATIGGIGTQVVIDYLRAKGIQSQLVEVSSNLNRQAPKMVDSLTRLDSTSVTDGKTLHYHYTLVSTHLAQVDVPKFTRLMRVNILATYRTNPDMGTFRIGGVSLSYDYFDEDGKPIATILVGPKDLP